MKQEFNVLICGSQNFNDRNFVFGMMDALVDSGFPIANLVVGKFSGACEFAQQWLENHNEKRQKGHRIGLKDFDFDMHLGNANLSLYEQIDIPDIVLNTDTFFLRGKEQIIKKDVKLVLAFPNQSGELGPSTKNIVRFATMAKVKHLDCSEALELIEQHRKTKEQELYKKETATPKKRMQP